MNDPFESFLQRHAGALGVTEVDAELAEAIEYLMANKPKPMFNEAGINLTLAKERGLTEDDVKELERLHEKLSDVLQNPEQYTRPVNVIRTIEYALQKVWKFPLDDAYHTYWNRIKGCSCPTLDNIPGSGRKIVSSSCKWHWHSSF